MHLRRARLLAAASATTLATLAVAGPAAADDRGKPDPHHGFSIQAAVDAAKPGDTIRIPPGTYHESVTITKDGIRLLADRVVIAPAGADPTACDTFDDPESDRVSGICILGEVDPETFAPIDPVTGVTVRGVTVTGASGDGLVSLGTEHLRVADSRFTDNDGYGAAAFVTRGVAFHGNKATGNGEAGFYIGDSEKAHANVRGNHSADNMMGFFFRNASVGEARGNVADGNCLGMLLLAGAPGPVTDWKLRDNKVTGNNKVCADDLPISGAGIVLLGAQEFHVRGNAVLDNNSEAVSVVEGGIVVQSSFPAPPEEPQVPVFEPSGEVERNKAKGNQPADLVWDGTGDVDFDRNQCLASLPEGLCG
ncbi:hypothetical protein E9529_05900 [Blastococcus sp. KM273128]|uniref:right-handed parallel beta-helix repeat-containing protein n=1 Tax=Blastococcus sp. KM273128 TaxID=2570314 RepID=UPI001F40C71F|nr:right-handed parallel beta-helix repeat-containing protein [Blastococcus sp. KM273128]MCF6743812.1 hypothetical protein [Blastococcus sp. KM273128]